MRSFKTILLAGASALLATAALSAPASAVEVAGGGSSLIAPYLSQAFGCVVGSTNISNPAVAGDHAHRYVPALTTIAACPVTPDATTEIDPTNIFNYLQSSSTGAFAGFFTQDPNHLISPAGSVPVGNVVFGASDAALISSQVTVFNSGGTDSVTGLVFASSPSAGQFQIPKVALGGANLIQIPLSIDPIALVYNPNFGTSSTFNIQTPDGKLRLNKSTICKIYNHEITDWNDSALSALNTSNGTPNSLTGGVSVTIQLGNRSDGSGTTDILTRFLANTCTGLVVTNHYSDVQGTTTIPSAASTFFTLPGSGSGGMATAVNGNKASLGYIGADWDADFHTASGATALVLPAATVLNGTTATRPGPADAITAFGTVSAPTGSNQTNPLNWVPTTSIANPSSGYPIIGTTNALLASQYDADTVAALVGDPNQGTTGFLGWYYGETDITKGSNAVLSNAGLAPLPASWKAAINDAFVLGNAQSINIVTAP